MKEAIGNAFIVNFIIVFTVIFIALFVGSLAYTKALRIKNRITDIIEEHQGYDTQNQEIQEEINTYLKDAGYRISNVDARDCQLKGQDKYTVVFPGQTTSGDYDYCIFEFETPKGKYYGVKTYMYLDLPIIGDKIKIGVYGETKIMGILGT